MSELRESAIMSSVMESVRGELGGEILEKLQELWLSKMSVLDASPGRLGEEIEDLEDSYQGVSEENSDEVEIIAIASTSCSSQGSLPPLAPIPKSRERRLIQMDGANDSSDDDIDNDEDEEDEDDEDDDDEDEDEDGDNIDDEDNEEGGVEEEPLGSNDDISDEDPSDLFDTDNVVVCQYDKITRARNKWKFHLKDGIMHLNGKDYVFQRANGDAEW